MDCARWAEAANSNAYLELRQRNAALLNFFLILQGMLLLLFRLFLYIALSLSNRCHAFSVDQVLNSSHLESLYKQEPDRMPVGGKIAPAEAPAADSGQLVRPAQ